MRRITFILIFIIPTFFAVFGKAESNRHESYNYSRGLEAMKNEDYKEAYDYMSREIKDNPRNGYAYCWLAVMDKYNEDYGRSLSNCDLALKYLPKKDKEYIAFAHQLKAETYRNMLQPYDAIRELSTALQYTPEDVDLLNSRGYLYYLLGNYKGAESDYKTIVELQPANSLGYNGLGRNLIALEEYDDAIKQLNYAIKLDSSYGRSYAFRAQCYIAKQDWNRATDDLISALATDSDDKAFRLMQDLEGQALDTFIAKLKIQNAKEPNSAEWMYYAGVVSENADRYNDAIEFYKKAFEIESHPITAKRLAETYIQLSNYSTALEWANKALTLAPDDGDITLLKANLLYETGNISDAIHEADKVVAQYPEYSFGYYRRGFFKDNGHKKDEALEDYSLAIALDPDYAYAYLARGDIYKGKGDMQKAFADYNKVIEIDSIPQNGSCAQYAFLELGQQEKAVAFMDAIIEQDKNNPANYYEVACLYARMGATDKALGSLMIALGKGYSRFAHMMNDDDLASIRDTETFQHLMREYNTLSSEPLVPSETKLVNEVVTIPITKDGGVYKVKCTINELPLYFIFDTGAASVSLSLVEANFMMKNGYLKPSDVVGSQNFIDANGDISEGTIINLRQVNFGGLDLSNVKASVVRNQKAPLLLGQTILSRLGKIEIDNSNQQLKITHSKEVK